MLESSIYATKIQDTLTIILINWFGYVIPCFKHIAPIFQLYKVHLLLNETHVRITVFLQGNLNASPTY